MSLLQRGEKSYLNPERIQKLNDIGFAWNVDVFNPTQNNNKIKTESTSSFFAAPNQHIQQLLQTPADIVTLGLQILERSEDIDANTNGKQNDENKNSLAARPNDSVPLEIVVVKPTPSNFEEEIEVEEI